MNNFVLYVIDADVCITVALLMFPCDDKPGFNLCKTLSVYILTQHTTGCYETGHPLLRLCYTIEVATSRHSVVSAACV